MKQLSQTDHKQEQRLKDIQLVLGSQAKNLFSFVFEIFLEGFACSPSTRIAAERG